MVGYRERPAARCVRDVLETPAYVLSGRSASLVARRGGGEQAPRGIPLQPVWDPASAGFLRLRIFREPLVEGESSRPDYRRRIHVGLRRPSLEHWPGRAPGRVLLRAGVGGESTRRSGARFRLQTSTSGMPLDRG